MHMCKRVGLTDEGQGYGFFNAKTSEMALDEIGGNVKWIEL